MNHVFNQDHRDRPWVTDITEHRTQERKIYRAVALDDLWPHVEDWSIDRRRRTRIELADAIFEHHKTFHNRQDRHPALGMLTPTEYELRTTLPDVIDPVA